MAESSLTIGMPHGLEHDGRATRLKNRSQTAADAGEQSSVTVNHTGPGHRVGFAAGTANRMGGSR